MILIFSLNVTSCNELYVNLTTLNHLCLCFFFLPRSHCSPQGRVFPAGWRGLDLQRAQKRHGGDLLRVLLPLRPRVGARVQHVSRQNLGWASCRPDWHAQLFHFALNLKMFIPCAQWCSVVCVRCIWRRSPMGSRNSSLLSPTTTQVEPHTISAVHVLYEMLKYMELNEPFIKLDNVLYPTFFSFLLPVCPKQATAQRRIQMNVAVQMAAVSAPTWAPCVNVTQALGWTTLAPAV